ncbi:MAG: toll/interleukin-1 receptor domain-containing protein [Clostridia bacterium]|nr:toll/interleukin-1 receptor domain-containing protein [Clostridia bacterium]
MKKIFFSYTFRDKTINKDFFLLLRRWSEEQGCSCYIDYLDNDYDKDGFQAKLVKELQDSNLFFVLDSEEYHFSEWARKELEEAKANKLEIVTILSAELESYIQNGGTLDQLLNHG